MSDIKSTTWDITPHTKAKHQILEAYLKAWFPILSSWNKKILYIDGFSGPGEYSGGEEGSPLIAIRTALDHKFSNSFNKIIFLFIEKDKYRLTNLKKVISMKFPSLPEKFTIITAGGEFQKFLSPILSNAQKEGNKLAPAFIFIDPFGFSDFPMSLINQIFTFKTTEILVTFMSGFINRFSALESNEKTLNDLFGNDGWKEANYLKGKEKERFIINYYNSRLKEIAKVKYTRHLEVRDNNDKLIYHLIFGTKNLRGLEAMKDAMYKVDRRGTYRFSDSTDPKQKYILDYNKDSWMLNAAQEVAKKFKGQTISLEDIKEYVLISTPYVFRKSILKHLENSASPKIQVIGRKKKLSYPDDCIISFLMN